MSKFAFAVYPAVALVSLAAAFSAHAQSMNDPVDQAAYGAMPAKTATVLTRAEVRSAAIAARAAGYDSFYRESGDAGFAQAATAKPAASAHVVAGNTVKAAQ